MRTLTTGLVALAALVVVPFLLRPPEVGQDPHSRAVVVMTPHNEAIRYEFARGFVKRARARGQSVRVDYRNPGGTSEIARFLGAEFSAAFELYWTRSLGRPFNGVVASAFANGKQSPEGGSEGSTARREFLRSDVGVKVDVLFGGGSFDFGQHAAAGRLVDSGLRRLRPELFGPEGIPPSVGGEPYWDPQGRWVGACLSGFGICYNPGVVQRLGIDFPARWSDLSSPGYLGQIALTDPSKSGSATKAFEMIVQQAMADAVSVHGPASADRADPATLAQGFDAAMRLIRRIAGNARYFTDSANKIPIDVKAGNAAAGMCIDFYGRFQGADVAGGERLRFVTPEAGSSVGSDPIGQLRGAPSPDLARDFIDYVLSPEGQALWDDRRGTPHGPERHELRRLPILPLLYTPEYNARRADPEVNPYQSSSSFTYRPRWTGPLFRALAFTIRVACIDTEEELRAAWRALIAANFPPRATQLFDDVSAIGYEKTSAVIAPALERSDPLGEVGLSNRLISELRRQYTEVARLAKAGT